MSEQIVRFRDTAGKDDNGDPIPVDTPALPIVPIQVAPGATSVVDGVAVNV